MRCPKCGYISFDHNDSCPKCNRDLSSERERLNLVPFLPNPPFLLASLLGNTNESGMHYHPVESANLDSLDEEIEFEAETEQVVELPSSKDEQADIEIEIESLGEEEALSPRTQHLDTTDAKALAIGLEERGSPEGSSEISTLETHTAQGLETLEVEAEKSEKEKALQEGEPLVVEREDINLEESPIDDELELELLDDDLSERPTEAYATTEDQLDLTLDEEPSVIDEIEGIGEVVNDDKARLATTEPIACEPVIDRRSDNEPTLSLEDLKDDELGKEDVTIDEIEMPTKKTVKANGG